MAGYEVEQSDHSTELRYDMGFTNYPVANDGIATGLNYNQEFDWTHGQENVYAPRAMYPMQENLDQQHGGYLGYGSNPQGDIGTIPVPSYISPSEMSFATPLGHVPYPGHDNYYAQPYSAISPSSTGSNTSTGSTGHGASGQKPKRKRTQTGTQRKAANVRERRRMFHLNEAFDELRKRLPAFNYEKRLSRIETLRLAMTYIAFMKDVSDGKEPDSVRLLEIQRKSEEQFPDTDDESD
mgnify:CR=1 FL=1